LKKTARDTKALFNNLQEAKFDCSSLTISELLIKDFKDWELPNTRYGMSSVTASISRLVDPNVEKLFAEFCTKNNLVILVCMTAHSTTGKFSRELCIYFANHNDARISGFVNSMLLEKEILDLVPISEYNTSQKPYLSYYSQKNIKSSRKQVQPLIHKLLSASKY